MSTGEPDKPRLFMALPERVDDTRPLFHWYLAEVLGLTGGELPPGLGPTGLEVFMWEHVARAAVIASLPQGGPWPEPVFDALMRAIVHDPDPSFNRQLIDPAMAAAGRRAVQEALLACWPVAPTARRQASPGRGTGRTPTQVLQGWRSGGRASLRMAASAQS